MLDIDKSLRELMDVALDKLSILDERYISPIPVAGYADDTVLISLLENVMMSMVQKLKDNIKNNQLHVRSDKVQSSMSAEVESQEPKRTYPRPLSLTMNSYQYYSAMKNLFI